MRKVYLALGLLLAACGQGSMDSQPKFKPYRPTGLFADGSTDQAPPAGTVARGAIEEEAALATHPPMTLALLQRGQERFTIYCSPCHGRVGDGAGSVVQRGFPRPPDFDEPRLLAADDRHFLDVITAGYGAMYAYADRVAPADRWAIVAYVRALQFSQHAPLAELPADMQAAARSAAP